MPARGLRTRDNEPLLKDMTGGDMSLCLREGLELATEHAKEKAHAMTEAARYIIQSKDQWRTPPELEVALRRRFDFDWDAAATSDNALFGDGPYFPDVNSLDLQEHWAMYGRVIYLNPPYSGKGSGDDPRTSLADWVDAAIRAAGDGCTVVAVLPADPSVGWWLTAFDAATEVYTLGRRVSFLDADDAPIQGNRGGTAVFVFTPRLDLSLWRARRIK